jgi:predicted O-methyltransferase YrrM
MRLRRRQPPARALTPEESAFVDRIETERMRLEASDEEIELVDYGARPDEQLSPAEMAAGRTVRRVVGEVCRTSSKPPPAARILFDLIRDERPAMCLELGTCLGLSAAYEAAALELNGDGFLHTVEGSEPLASRAAEVISRVGLGHRVDVHTGRFADVLPGLLEESTFDYVFVDGHHDEGATIGYFEQIAPRVNGGKVMVFDDIGWSEGMRNAWKTIRSRPEVASSTEHGGLGLVKIN